MAVDQKFPNYRKLSYTVPDCIALYYTVLHCILLYYSVFNCTDHVPWREEGSTGKYQHEVLGVPEGTPETEYWYFPVLPDLSQGTDIIQFIKVIKL